MADLSLNILIVDDDQKQYRLVDDMLAAAMLNPFKTTWTATYEAGLSELRSGIYDVCLLDYELGDKNGLDLLRIAQAEDIATPMILITGYGNRDVDMQAMRAGAVDYLDKTKLRPDILERTVRYAYERARTIRALRESEERFRSLIGTIPAGIFIYQHGRLRYVNEMFSILTLYQADELLKMDLLDLAPPDFRSTLAHWLPTSGNGYQPSQSEIPLITQQGKTRWFSLTMSQIDHEGKPAVLGALINITKRKQIEQALWESEKRFRSLIENSSDMVTQLNASGHIIYASPSCQRLLGYAEHEMLDNPITAFIHPNDQAEAGQMIDDLVQLRNEVLIGRYRMQHKQRRWVWIESIGTNLFDEEGINSLVINSRDITENVQMMLAEQEQRALAEALVDTAHTLNSTLQFDEVLDRILTNVGQVIRHDAANIMLLEGGKTRVVGYRSYIDHTHEEHTRNSRFSVMKTPILNQMLETHQPVLVTDTGQHPDWISFPGQMNPKSYIGAPILVGNKVIGFINLDSFKAGFFEQRDADRLRDFTNQAAVAIKNARVYEQAQELAAAEERQRLARDLHDAVSQTLFSASVMAETLPRLIEADPDEVRQGLGKLARLTKGALSEMRALLVELRPTALVETELGILLGYLINGVRSRTDAAVDLSIAGNRYLLPPDVQVSFYRIAQEALNNIIKHANATHIGMTLTYRTKRVVLMVIDDGQGFDIGAIPPDHMGVRIMQERAQSVGAQLDIQSAPDEGTAITLSWAKTK